MLVCLLMYRTYWHLLSPQWHVNELLNGGIEAPGGLVVSSRQALHLTWIIDDYSKSVLQCMCHALLSIIISCVCMLGFNLILFLYGNILGSYSSISVEVEEILLGLLILCYNLFKQITLLQMEHNFDIVSMYCVFKNHSKFKFWVFIE